MRNAEEVEKKEKQEKRLENDWNDFHSLFCGDDVLSCQNILPPQRERNLGKSDTASESG